MSIVAVFLQPTRALVGVDTESITASGERCQTSKLVPIVHLNAVITGRGSAGYVAGLFLGVLSQPFRDFDELHSGLRDFLQKFFTEGAPGMIVLVGWSPKHQCMLGRWFERPDPDGPWSAADIEEQFFAPGDDSLPEVSSSESYLDMIAIAKAQVALIREKAPGAAAGGRLIVAELARRSMSIADAGAL